MKISVTGRNIKVTPALKEYIDEKISKLEHFDERIISSKVILGVEKQRHIAEITLQTAGSTIHVSEDTDDLYKSIDKSTDMLARKLKKVRDKMAHNKKGAATPRHFHPEELYEGVEVDGSHIVQVDRYVKKPMSVEEAAMQMDLLKNDFIVFTNSASERINVIYRRKDGDLGLIDPKS